MRFLEERIREVSLSFRCSAWAFEKQDNLYTLAEGIMILVRVCNAVKETFITL